MTELVGNTPLMELTRFAEAAGVSKGVHFLGKMEFLNPAGSAKDRVGLCMIEEAEKRGELKPGGTIIESTSGNTGIGLAAVAAAKGYHVLITLPETMSRERRLMLSAYGAELVLTDGEKGMSGAIEKANELHESIPGSILAGQFVNPDNPLAHYRTTGPEIYRDLEGCPDAFVACVGTGGTITGTGRFLKEKDPGMKIVAVEPADSPVLSGGKAGSHKLQGIGAGFVPDILDTSVYDEVMTVTTEESFAAGRLLAAKEGVLCGITSGSALAAAVRLAKKPEMEGKTIVVLLPDSGDRYLSSGLFE